MKRKMKITISALAVMFVAAIAVAIASFSFAGNGDKDDVLQDGMYVADASGAVSEKTIIDYIIFIISRRLHLHQHHLHWNHLLVQMDLRIM